MKLFLIVIFICVLLFILKKKSYSIVIPIHYIFSTPETRNKGLMYRKKPLPKNVGALFVFDAPTNVSFWMKNTFIPLDILFLNSDKKVIELYKNTTPLNIKKRYSAKNTNYAIELNAYTIEQLKVNKGDTIVFDTSSI